MQRRKLLERIATAGLVSVTAGTAAGRRTASRSEGIDGLDALHVVRDDEVVRTVENPTPRDFKRMEALLGADEALVNAAGECSTYCKQDCDAVCDEGDTCYYNCSCSECDSCCGPGEA